MSGCTEDRLVEQPAIKVNGLIVDDANVFQKLENALAIYGSVTAEC